MHNATDKFSALHCTNHHDGPKTRRTCAPRGLTILALILATAFSSASLAGVPGAPSFVGETEMAVWNFPYVDSSTPFLSVDFGHNNSKAMLDKSGKTVQNPISGHTYEIIPSIGFIFPAISPWNGIPPIGSFFKATVSYQSGQYDHTQFPSGHSISGMGDLSLDAGIYIKPFDGTQWMGYSVANTVGVQSVLSIPTGSDPVSGHAWVSTPFLYGDTRIGKVGFDWLAGVALIGRVRPSASALTTCNVANQALQNATDGSIPILPGLMSYANSCGAEVKPGNIYFGFFTLRYELNSKFWFGVSDMYQVARPGRLISVRGSTVASANSRLQGSMVNKIGPAVRFNVAPTLILSAWYLTNLASTGHNVPKDNTLWVRVTKRL